MARSTADTRPIVQGWTASYTPALHVAQGERLTSGKTDPDNPLWRWTTNAGGLGGWLPEGLVVDGIALRSFDSTELTVLPGQRVTVHEQLNGWSLCSTQDGIYGWLPDTCLGAA